MIRVLHVLDHSLPEHDGYSLRSHAILTHLKQIGLDIRVITGPKQASVTTDRDVIDGIHYMRTPINGNVASQSGIASQLRTIVATRKRVFDYLQQNEIDVIHAHSPCLNGIAALGLKRPLVYEMRSSWEDASVSVGTTREGSLRYRLSKMLETFVVKQADTSVVICDGLRSELICRGVPKRQIVVVPNAVPEHMFTRPDIEKVSEVRRRFALNDCQVIGFFGSFFEWEGVDDLIQALPVVIRAVPNAKLLIAGGGRQESALRELVISLGLDSSVVFAGRIPHSDIAACYAAADIMAYPRKPDRLTDMVTPLKPLEAMAQGIAVVASDVGGHNELVANGDTGILFEAGNHEDLARKIIGVLTNSNHTGRITTRALEYVRRHRRWSTVVERYVPVYQRLVDSRNK